MSKGAKSVRQYTIECIHRWHGRLFTPVRKKRRDGFTVRIHGSYRLWPAQICQELSRQVFAFEQSLDVLHLFPVDKWVHVNWHDERTGKFRQVCYQSKYVTGRCYNTLGSRAFNWPAGYAEGLCNTDEKVVKPGNTRLYWRADIELALNPGFILIEFVERERSLLDDFV